MQAVVMAAGEGRRMRPLTERWAKPALPIDGRPVIGTLLRDLAEAGIERATVVTGHLAEQVEGLVGDGSAFGLAVSYVHQPEPLGSADAVLRALQAGAGPHGAIAGRREPPPSPPHRLPLRVVEGRVERVLDDDPENPIGGAPLWLVGSAVARFLDPLPGNPPYELSSAFQLAIDSGAEIRGGEIGATRDLTS